jgi:hypothetical protein
MSLKNRLRTIACCVVLQAATLIGVPMRPEQVADLMRSLNQPKIARTTPKESEKDGARVRTSSHHLNRSREAGRAAAALH